MNDRGDPPFPIAMNKVEEPAFTKYTFSLAFALAVFIIFIVIIIMIIKMKSSGSSYL